MVGCAPADSGALQTCHVIQGFPGRIQEARDHAGVKPPLLAQELLEQGAKRKREAGEVIICVEVLSRTLQGRGRIGRLGRSSVLLSYIRWFRKVSQTADTGHLFSVHYFSPFLINCYCV